MAPLAEALAVQTEKAMAPLVKITAVQTEKAMAPLVKIAAVQTEKAMAPLAEALAVQTEKAMAPGVEVLTASTAKAMAPVMKALMASTTRVVVPILANLAYGLERSFDQPAPRPVPDQLPDLSTWLGSLQVQSLLVTLEWLVILLAVARHLTDDRLDVIPEQVELVIGFVLATMHSLAFARTRS